MTVHVLGAAGWIPGVNETSCIMVENKGSLFILDAWDGISADLLFHECWEYRTPVHDRHTSLQQLKSQLSLSDFGEIYLIHHNPEWRDEDFKEIREMTEKTNIALAEKLLDIFHSNNRSIIKNTEEKIMFSVRPNAPHNNEAKYYICARRDNGFIPAYRAYYFIHGNKIKRVSVFRYEHCVTFGKRADEYEFFSPAYYVFNIKAENNDPSEWKIRQNEYEKVKYDINALIRLLKKTVITLKGYIELVLHEFDGYQLIYMARTDQDGHGTILGEQSLFFKDGNPIKIGRKIRLDDVRDFYRYCK